MANGKRLMKKELLCLGALSCINRYKIIEKIFLIPNS